MFHSWQMMKKKWVAKSFVLAAWSIGCCKCWIVRNKTHLWGCERGRLVGVRLVHLSLLCPSAWVSVWVAETQAKVFPLAFFSLLPTNKPVSELLLGYIGLLLFSGRWPFPSSSVFVHEHMCACVFIWYQCMMRANQRRKETEWQSVEQR